MPYNLTDVSTFTDPIQTVIDGDGGNATNFALAPQGLANRTRHLKNRADARDAFALYAVSGTAVSALNKFTLTETLDPSSAYALSSNSITFPALGYYEISASVLMTSSDTTDGLLLAAALNYNSSPVLNVIGKRFSTETGDSVNAYSSLILQVTSLAHLLDLGNAGGRPATTAQGILTVRRLT